MYIVNSYCISLVLSFARLLKHKCEGVEKGLVTCLTWITRLQDGLVAVSIVTVFQMLLWLGLAIGYVVVMCSMKPKKQNKEKRSRKYRQEEWQEDVKTMESCLKANKEKRKERREHARIVERSRQCEAEKRAQKKDSRVAMENQHFLNAHKRLAESQL